jgi:SAM-dependent methyltransferase
LRAHTFTEGIEGHIRNGVLICESCGEWYPISDDVLELVRPDLLYSVDSNIFHRDFDRELNALGCTPHDIANGKKSPGPEHSEQWKQRQHFDRYAAGLESGFKDYTQTRFIQAASARFIALRNAQLGASRSWILDIGCGTGIGDFDFPVGHTVAGFDVSKKAIRRATELARVRKLMSNTTFFVGDGEFLSFKSESFEFVQTFGSLHHLPNPDQAIKDIIRILKPGGRYFGVENNKSSLRWIFDLMMKLRPLWIEEAGAEPLISERMLNGWAAGLPAEVHCETSIFLPPHVINLFGFAAARAAVDWSDRVCSCVPWLRSNGGQIVYHMRKVH